MSHNLTGILRPVFEQDPENRARLLKQQQTID
jgi:hypothetical protein